MVARQRRPARTPHTRVNAPRIPYIRARRERTRPWLRIPHGFPGSNLEWATMWYLSIHGVGPSRRKLILGRDFFWQKAISAPGLFFLRGFTRGDFVLPGYPGARRGIILDPITPFTHKTAWFDLRKRTILFLQGWKVIFLDGVPLLRNPGPLIEYALRGIDLSKRGRGGA